MSELSTNLRDKALLNFLMDTEWAMYEPILSQLVEIVGRHSDGVKMDAREIERVIGNSPMANRDGEAGSARAYRLEGSTAVIPVYGVIAKYASQVNDISQPSGTSVQQIQADLSKALDDRKVESIVLDIESPGGSISGIPDLARQIAAAGRIKPVVAMSADLVASGAYWLGSQACAFYAGKAADVGGIGVYTLLRDSSASAERVGVRYHLVRSGPFKGVGVGGISVNEEDLAYVQGRVDAKAAIFAEEVAAGRGMDVEQVVALATGGTWTGREAVPLGLVDGVSTMEEVLSALAEGQLPGGAKAAPKTNSIGRSDGPTGRSAYGGPTVAASDKERDMAEQKNSPPAIGGPAADADREAIVAAAEMKANAQAAERVTALTAVLGGRTELLTKAITEGMDVTAAKAALADVLTVEAAAAAKALTGEQEAHAATRTELDSLKALAAASGIKPVDLKEEPAGGDGGYEAAVEERRIDLLAKKVPEAKARAQAFAEIAREHPELHAAWKQAAPQKAQSA